MANNRDEHRNRDLTRRTFLGGTAAAAATAILAACGSSSTATTTPAPKASAAGFTGGRRGEPGSSGDNRIHVGPNDCGSSNDRHVTNDRCSK